MIKHLLCAVLAVLAAAVCAMPTEPNYEDGEEGVPIPERSQIELTEKFCFNYRCLAGLKDHMEKDRQCRVMSVLNRERWCYCCGGEKDYHTYGTVCRKYCVQEKYFVNDTFHSPCEPSDSVKLENAREDNNGSNPFPDIPILTDLKDINCKRKKGEDPIYGPNWKDPAEGTTTTESSQGPAGVAVESSAAGTPKPVRQEQDGAQQFNLQPQKEGQQPDLEEVSTRRADTVTPWPSDDNNQDRDQVRTGGGQSQDAAPRDDFQGGQSSLVTNSGSRANDDPGRREKGDIVFPKDVTEETQ